MHTTSVLLCSLLLTASSSSADSDLNSAAQEILKYADPDVVINQRPISMMGVKSENRAPLFSFYQSGSTSKYNFILYKDGTIYWRPDWQEVTAPKIHQITINAEKENTVSITFGPYYKGMVSIESLEAFQQNIVSSGYCSDPGYSFLLYQLTNPTPSESIFNYSTEDCAFGLFTRFDHVSESQFATPRKPIDRHGKSDDEMLADMHPRIRRSYETHHQLKKQVGSFIEEAIRNQSMTELGFIDLEHFKVAHHDQPLRINLPICDAVSTAPIITLYHSGKDNPNVETAIWENGTIIWLHETTEANQEYRIAELSMEDRDIFLNKICDLIQRTPTPERFDSFGPEGSFTTIAVQTPQCRLYWRSWHELMEASGTNVSIDGAIRRLSKDETLEQARLLSTTEYNTFLHSWEAIRHLLQVTTNKYYPDSQLIQTEFRSNWIIESSY